MPGIDRRLIQHFDWSLFGTALLLALVGVGNLVSAAPESAATGMPDTALRQLTFLGIGLIVLLVALIPDYRILERLALPLYLGTLVLLVVLLFAGPVINGSQRWLVMGSLRLQPSELAKLALLVLFARILTRRATAPELRLRDLIGPALLAAAPVALVLRQPDLGTAMLLALIAGTFILFSRIRIRSLLWLGAAGVAAAGSAWFFYLHDYQKERVLTFLDPDRDPLGSAYHAIQSQIAVGSGGWFGMGFMRGPQSQLDFLPEQQTDFVFSVLAEEWGFIGAALVLLLYLAILVRGLLVARDAKEPFGAYLAIGIVALLFWPVVINVAMVIGLAPVVGVPLPLLSYGGSSLITCMAGLGLLINVSMRRYVF
jgi:rod shape determining protein RodA